MYFRNNVLRKSWFDKCPESLVSKDAVPNTVEFCTTAPLSYLLITLQEIELEKVSPSDL